MLSCNEVRGQLKAPHHSFFLSKLIPDSPVLGGGRVFVTVSQFSETEGYGLDHVPKPGLELEGCTVSAKNLDFSDTFWIKVKRLNRSVFENDVTVY